MADQKIALLHNHFDTDHLDAVVADMKTLGAPTIRVLDLGFDCLYQALEGSHRLRACEILGVTPILDCVGSDETVASLNLDFDNGRNSQDVGVAEIGDWENYQIVIEDGVLVRPEDQ